MHSQQGHYRKKSLGKNLLMWSFDHLAEVTHEQSKKKTSGLLDILETHVNRQV